VSSNPYRIIVTPPGHADGSLITNKEIANHVLLLTQERLAGPGGVLGCTVHIEKTEDSAPHAQTGSEITKRVAAVVPGLTHEQRPKGTITGEDPETHTITIAWDEGAVETVCYGNLGVTWVYAPAYTAEDTTP